MMFGEEAFELRDDNRELDDRSFEDFRLDEADVDSKDGRGDLVWAASVACRSRETTLFLVWAVRAGDDLATGEALAP